MSFLSEIQSKVKKLRATETTITYADGTREKVSSDKKTIKLESASYGFVEDTKPDQIPACILDEFLYLGAQDAVCLLNIREYGLTNILSVGIESPQSNITEDENIQFHFVSCLDLPETNLKAVLEKTNKIIDEVRAQNGRILIHCNAGVSRASSICIGYLIHVNLMNFTEAFDLVKSRRECIQPNQGFLKQLKEISKEIFEK